MPATFIFAIILAVFTAGAVLTWVLASPLPEQPAQRHPYSNSSDPFPLKKAAGITAITLGALTALFVLISSWTPVGTQNIGIVTSFGRPVSHLDNGLHFIAPWDQVTQMDGAIQTDSYTGSQCINIRVAQQQTACATVSIRWRIRPDAVDELFRNYQYPTVFTAIQDSLVTRELAVALNRQFAGYDPIASLTSSVKPGQPGNPTVAQLAAAVTSQMQREIGSQIQVDNVLIPLVTYDATVQNRINTVLAQTAQTDVAEQAIRTAQAQAQANKDLAASVSNNPGVLQSQCLNLVNEAIKANYQFPAGFSCFGGSSVGVVASSK